MTASLECPGMECWQALFSDRVSAQQREHYERHLESCTACQEQLDRTKACSERVRNLVRQVASPDAAPAEQALVQFLERLQEGKHTVRPDPVEPSDLYFLQATDRPDLLGFLGVYEVQEVIGQGEMGVVLKAYDPVLHRLVAIKVLAEALAGSATARQRFIREAQAAASVCHDHVVALHGVAETNGLPYLIMHYVAGESLQERLNRTGPLEIEEVVRIGMQTASGLAAAHAQGLIHRDVKPANLLLENGLAKVKITDFGLARMADDVGLTRNGVVVGTPEYMAPEQARGEPIDFRADLFSLGSVLYAMCTGHSPFQGGSAVAVLRQVSDQTPARLRTLNPEVPAWLEAVIRRLLAKDPAERFQNAAEVAALLEGYLAHLRQPATVPAPALPSPERTADSRTPGRRTWPFPLLLTFLCLLVGFVLLVFQPAAAPPAAERSWSEIYYDFRGKPLPAELTLVGAEQFVHCEPEGLRITMPKDRKDLRHAGVARIAEIRGDFEITTTFEVLHAEIPPSGYGVGVSMLIQKAVRTREGTTLCRLARPQGNQVVLWDRSIEDPGGDLRFEGGPSPCSERVGRLRLKRVGAVLHYLWAPGTTGNEFEEVHQCEFGSEELERVSLRGLSSQRRCDLDCRYLDLRIRTSEPAPALPATAPEPAPPAKGTWKLVLVSVLGLALVVGIWFGVRQHLRAAPIPEPAPDRQAPSEPASAVVSFPCPECAKPLRARPALAGKKVKCPQCKRAVLVPATSADDKVTR
jgi:serine/threonine protein kinase